MLDINKTIGYRITTAIAARDTTQKRLAEYLGQKPNVISYWCSGTRTPNAEQLVETAKFLKVSTDYLLGLSDVMSCNNDVKTASITTGLSEYAINNLAGSFDIRYFIDMVSSYSEINQLARAFKSYIQIEHHMKPDIIKHFHAIESAESLSDTDRNAIQKEFECMERAFLSEKRGNAQTECEREFRHLLESIGGADYGKHNPTKE